MAVRSNQFFNNPAFAQAASNLAGLFEPPSGADAAGWAAANAKKAEAARLADFYDYARSPDFDQQQFDRLGVGAGAYNPSQSYYNVDQGNATQRYGYDTQAATSRSNNAADNVRALEVGRLGELGNLFEPIAQGAVRPALPEDIASQFGVGRALPAEQGLAKPLSETELKAAILGGMDQSLQEAAAFGSTPVETIATPEGPRIQTRLAAIGEAPAPKEEAPGVSVTLPDGTVVQQGGKALTEAQSKDSVYFTRGAGSLPIIDQYGNSLTSLTENTAGRVPGPLGNYVKTPEYQMAEQAGDEFLQAILRKDTGAAITPSERAEYARVYLPEPGNSPELLAQKKVARQRALAAIRIGLPPAAILALESAGVDLSQGSIPKAADGVPAAPAPAPAEPVAGYPEGTIIENAAGEELVLRNGQWVPNNGK